MFDYKGITYDWSGPYDETCIRVGAYRDSGKQFGIEYSDQTIHFDDFIVVSDENTLDQLIRKNENPCLLYTSPSPRDSRVSRMPSSA